MTDKLFAGPVYVYYIVINAFLKFPQNKLQIGKLTTEEKTVESEKPESRGPSLPSLTMPSIIIGRLFFLILDRLLVMSFFLRDQFRLSFFIFLPAASAILERLETLLLAYS